MTRQQKDKTSARRAYDAIVALADAFCKQHLNEKYGALCRRLASVLARKRPTPINKGKPEAWASGIVRVIGWVNFLDDQSQTPHLKLTDIDRELGVSQAAGQAKAMTIRKQLKIHRLDPEWTLPAMDNDPLARPIPLDEKQPENDSGRDIGPASAADAAVLVGELHLRQGDYAKAIAAFTRAIENGETADAYQGRAKSYRGLAEQDEQKARERATKEARSYSQ